MRDAGRHKHRLALIRVQPYMEDLAAGRRRRPHVDQGVENGTHHAADQLALFRWWRLEVKATHHACSGSTGKVALSDIEVDSLLREFPFAESARKRTAPILPGLKSDQKGTGDWYRREDHGNAVACAVRPRSRVREFTLAAQSP